MSPEKGWECKLCKFREHSNENDNEIPIKQINILETGGKWDDFQSRLNDFSEEKVARGLVTTVWRRIKMSFVMKL